MGITVFNASKRTMRVEVWGPAKAGFIKFGWFHHHTTTKDSGDVWMEHKSPRDLGITLIGVDGWKKVLRTHQTSGNFTIIWGKGKGDYVGPLLLRGRPEDIKQRNESEFTEHDRVAELEKKLSEMEDKEKKKLIAAVKAIGEDVLQYFMTFDSATQALEVASSFEDIKKVREESSNQDIPDGFKKGSLLAMALAVGFPMDKIGPGSTNTYKTAENMDALKDEQGNTVFELVCKNFAFLKEQADTGSSSAGSSSAGSSEPPAKKQKC